MNTIDKLTEIFKEFPGIGERQAKRFVYFLMARTSAYNENLSSLISDLKKEVTQCKECFRFFVIPTQNNSNVCDICGNPNTENSALMIVEKDSDLESMHKSGVYNGKYFILGGLVPIVEKNTNKKVRVDELIKRIEKNKEKIKEIILAFSLNPQGNHTDFYIRNQLKPITESIGIKISSLGRGLSTGTELEYSDNDTLKNALKNRQ
jgi:recombination protein RecR